MKTIRTHLTFTFDESKVSEASVKDRLDQLLVEEFSGDVDDVHTRWYSNLSNAPLFGAGLATSNHEQKILRSELLRILLREEPTYANRRRLLGVARTLRASAGG